MKTVSIGLTVVLALALSACGDSSNSSNADDGSKPLGVPQLTVNDCTSSGAAISYVDQRQKAFMAAMKANKTTPDQFNGFAKTVSTEVEKAKASNDWVGYCKSIDAYLTGIGY